MSKFIANPDDIPDQRLNMYISMVSGYTMMPEQVTPELRQVARAAIREGMSDAIREALSENESAATCVVCGKPVPVGDLPDQYGECGRCHDEFYDDEEAK